MLDLNGDLSRCKGQQPQLGGGRLGIVVPAINGELQFSFTAIAEARVDPFLRMVPIVIEKAIFLNLSSF